MVGKFVISVSWSGTDNRRGSVTGTVASLTGIGLTTTDTEGCVDGGSTTRIGVSIKTDRCIDDGTGTVWLFVVGLVVGRDGVPGIAFEDGAPPRWIIAAGDRQPSTLGGCWFDTGVGEKEPGVASGPPDGAEIVARFAGNPVELAAGMALGLKFGVGPCDTTPGEMFGIVVDCW